MCVREGIVFKCVCKYVSGSRNQKVGTRKREREREKRERAFDDKIEKTIEKCFQTNPT